MRKDKLLPEIGNQIASVRLSCGYSRSELASGIQMSRTQITDIENGKQNPTVERLDQIADFLDVPSDYLLINFHDDFILNACDGYLSRISPDNLKAIIVNFLFFFGLESISSFEVFDTFFDVVPKESFKSEITKKQKIQRFRKENNYYQAQIAELIDMSYDHYVKFENNISNVSLFNHIKLCRALGKSSECITRNNRNDMVLSMSQMSKFHDFSKENKLVFLEMLRVIYENNFTQR